MARYWLLAALVVMLVAAPLVKADDDETPSVVDQYTKLATEYVNKGIEVASPYLETAQELAGEYYKKANEYLADTLDKLGVSKKTGKTEL